MLQYTTIHIDVNKFNQVIRNLLSNALKFSPINQSVDVYAFINLIPTSYDKNIQKKTSIVHSESLHSNNNMECILRIEVHDKGPGICKVCQSIYLSILLYCLIFLSISL
jgi:signal transduction histidine kinase